MFVDNEMNFHLSSLVRLLKEYIYSLVQQKLYLFLLGIVKVTIKKESVTRPLLTHPHKTNRIVLRQELVKAIYTDPFNIRIVNIIHPRDR